MVYHGSRQYSPRQFNLVLLLEVQSRNATSPLIRSPKKETFSKCIWQPGILSFHKFHFWEPIQKLLHSFFFMHREVSLQVPELPIWGGRSFCFLPGSWHRQTIRCLPMWNTTRGKSFQNEWVMSPVSSGDTVLVVRFYLCTASLSSSNTVLLTLLYQEVGACFIIKMPSLHLSNIS